MVDDDNATVLITDIQEALKTADREALAKPACLLAVGGELNGTIFDLIPGDTLLGRNVKNTFHLEFDGISRNHLKISVNEDETCYILEDIGSRNGTYVNNSKLEGTVELKKSDVVKMGSITLKFLPKGDTERLTYDKLHHDANTDKLTSCFNKAYFNKVLDNQVNKSKVTGDPLSLIFFDLDHFKHLNDNFGHDAGDYVLRELSKVIRENGVRDTDLFARFGGEEFTVILSKTNLKLGFKIAERFRKSVEEHDFLYEGKKLPVTASLGIADYRRGVSTGNDLLKRADSAVYKAKDGGRNRVCFFKEE